MLQIAPTSHGFTSGSSAGELRLGPESPDQGILSGNHKPGSRVGRTRPPIYGFEPATAPLHTWAAVLYFGICRR